MPIEKGLTERFVDQISIPGAHSASFENEIDPVDGNTAQPVRPGTGIFLPMTIELLGPKIKVNLAALQEDNRRLAEAEGDVYFAGSSRTTADNLLNTAEDYDYKQQLFNNIEPLILYVNPTNLTRTYQKKVQDQQTGTTRTVEFWGDEQDKLSASGRIGATYTKTTGLTRYYRRHAASYQQLMQLYIYYRNNGCLYESVNPAQIGIVGRVRITFDTEQWIGHFDSFSMSEAADNPYTMEYSFDFTVREYINNVSLSLNTAPSSTIVLPTGVRVTG